MATHACHFENPLLQEKRIERLTIRLSDTLKNRLSICAHENNTSVSDFLVHLAVTEIQLQETMGRTRSDNPLADLRRALALVEMESDLNAYQKLWVLAQITRFQMELIEGRSGKGLA